MRKKKIGKLLAIGGILTGIVLAAFLYQKDRREERPRRLRSGRVETGEALFSGLTQQEEAVDTKKFQLKQEEEREYITLYLALLEKLMEEEEYRGYFSYNLIYVNQDKIPELAVNIYDAGNNTISLYTCMDEELIEIIKDWPNGEDTANHYLPYQNIFRCEVYENQLLDIHTKYYQIDEEGKLDSNYSLLKKYKIDEEENIRYNWDFYTTYEKDHTSWRYFSKGEKISYTEYSSLLIEGEYEGIAGSYSAQEMKELLFSRLLGQGGIRIDQPLGAEN